MSKVKTNKKPLPNGWELFEPTLEELTAKIKDQSDMPIHKKYKQISLSTKVDILNCIQNGESIKNVMNKYNISRTGVRYIKKKEDDILKRAKIMQNENGDFKRTKLYGVENSALEKCLYKWFIQRRNFNEPITRSILKEKALLFNKELNGPNTFVASDGFLHRFKNRHGIKLLSLKEETQLSDVEKAVEFGLMFVKFVTENGYNWNNVYNADETSLAYKTLPTNTYAVSNEKHAPSQKTLNDRVTILVCANSTGSHKIDQLVIGEYKNPRCFHNSCNLPVNYRSQINSWMDRKIFLDWYENIFLPAAISRSNGEKILLLLDNAPSHPPADELNVIDERCQVFYLSPNTNASIQPMAQGVISTLKTAYKKQLICKLLSKNTTTEISMETFSKEWNLLDCLTNLKQAWYEVGEAVIKNSWKNLRLQEDTYKCNSTDPAEEIKNLVNTVSKNIVFTRDDIKTWLREDDLLPVFYELNDKEIVKSIVQGEFISFEGESPEVNTNEDILRTEIPSNNDALSACMVAYQWFSGQEDAFEYVKNLKQCMSFISKKICDNKCDINL